MTTLWVQYGIYLTLLVILAWPLGNYMARVMKGERCFCSRLLEPCEHGIYRLLDIDAREEMSWRRYGFSVLAFSLVGFVVLFVLHLVQGFLPLNPAGVSGTSWHLAFNNTASFVTNTNWQAYSGESSLSYLTQMLGLTVQNFVSAATGIAVLFALLRGLSRENSPGLGSFWVDMVRCICYILLPLALIVALLLVTQGVVQSWDGYVYATLLEPLVLADGTVLTQQVIPLGPAASQVAIKQLGTNGGGFFGVNSAFPLENPTAFSNLIEMLSILLIPVALCFSFGRFIKDSRQGRAVFGAMFLLLVVAVGAIGWAEQTATPQLAAQGQVNISSIGQAGGNMEGKEARFGIASSATWAAFTTAASNGSVNSMHDSYTPLGGMVPMILMQLGEVVFGGVGCGLYGMLGFVLLTVFMAGLMVGRTPEYLGKKIEPFEMKMAVLVCLATPVVILVGSGIACLVPSVTTLLGNTGSHGFSEVLYTFTSAGANNGSAFAGFNANTPFLNVTLGLCMLVARFVPLLAVLAIAGSMGQKRRVAVTAGTLSTCNSMFVGLLLFVVLLVGALSFFPALALGPIAEHFQSLR
ncbi:MAG: potassium-transporting ATPase subunit KdpA [Acidaminococcaceae bacterium]